MNIHEVSMKTGISLANLRKLEKLGVLKVDASDTSQIAPMRSHLSRNARLTVAHMITLIEQPELLDDLAPYSAKAQAQLDALGPVADTLAPRIVAHVVTEAASGDADALKILVDYVQEAAPGGDASFHFFAVRIGLAQFPTQRDATVKALNLAFAKVRAHPAMKNWWRNENGVIFYRRPLDL